MMQATSKLHTATVVAALSMVTSASGAQHESSEDSRTTAEMSAIVEQPRPFGHVIGSVVTQRVLLRAGALEFEPAALPSTERLGVWFERRAARIESSSESGRWLVVDYQIMNAPQSLTTVSLPAWELQSRDGGRTLSIPEWPISIAALTPRTAFGDGGLSDLRPDRAAPLIAIVPLRRQAGFWSGAFVVTLASWLAWVLWRNWRAASSQPFARALREVGSDDTTPEAWRALHRAFDATAGRVVQLDTLSVLFQRAPHLQPFSATIERFFTQSSERFFGGGLSVAPLSVRDLCSDLRRIEKRCEQ